mmetsp:Transcript_18744/g.43028  ORF Transcript_18744/g.43028 Transcript_18744/m.43028 type:complete len:242 (-) Transcript_18744:398-1123(-)
MRRSGAMLSGGISDKQAASDFTTAMAISSKAQPRSSSPRASSWMSALREDQPEGETTCLSTENLSATLMLPALQIITFVASRQYLMFKRLLRLSSATQGYRVQPIHGCQKQEKLNLLCMMSIRTTFRSRELPSTNSWKTSAASYSLLLRPLGSLPPSNFMAPVSLPSRSLASCKPSPSRGKLFPSTPSPPRIEHLLFFSASSTPSPWTSSHKILLSACLAHRSRSDAAEFLQLALACPRFS